MNNFSKMLLLILAYNFLSQNNIISQKIPIKWGKVSKEEIDIKSCNLDTSANAIVLCDYGEISFIPGKPIEVNRHRRIKILKKQGITEQSNIIIPFYSKDRIENVVGVTAQTINIAPDGKITIIKVEKDKIFDVDESQNWKEKRFTFSGVEVGSIIEYTYRLFSEYYLSPKEWCFQSDIPTIHSEYRAKIEQSLEVNYFIKGNQIQHLYANQPSNIFTLEYLDAASEEPYCPNPEDYKEKVFFQLASYYTEKDHKVEKITLASTWLKLAQELMNNANFTFYLNKKNLAKEYIDNNIPNLANLNKREKVIAIYNFVNSTFKWDGKYSLNIEKSLKQLIESKSGNGIEINMLLTTLLQAADLDASPALSSTKYHGIPSKSYTIINDFNHLLSHVKLYEEDLLLDATDPLRPYDLIGTENLNPNVFVVNVNSARLINPSQTAISKKQSTIIVDSIAQSHLIMESKMSFSNYSALDFRKRIQKSDNPSKVVNGILLPEIIDVKTDSCIIENENDISKPVSVRYYFQMEKDNGGTEGYLYLKPFMGLQFPKFISEKRNLPIDLIYKSEINHTFILKVPANYELISIPEQQYYSLDKQDAEFRIFVKNEKNMLSVRLVYSLSKTFFYPSNYKAIKEFYQKIEKAIETTIVLKEN